MILQCLNCDKGYEALRASSKYCSKKCKQAYLRNNEELVSVSPDSALSVSNETLTDDNVTETINPDVSVSNDNITNIYPSDLKTDKLFQDDAIKRNLGERWLRFSDIVRAPNCRTCGKTFKTRLALLNYCSPKCRREDAI